MSMTASSSRALLWFRPICYVGMVIVWVPVLLKLFIMMAAGFLMYESTGFPTTVSEMKALFSVSPILVTSFFVELSKVIISTAILAAAIALIDLRTHFYREKEQELAALKRRDEIARVESNSLYTSFRERRRQS